MLTELDSAFGSLCYGLILVPLVLLLIYCIISLAAAWADRKNKDDK